MKSIDVLATGKMMPLIMEQLESTFTLHHLPAEGRDAFLASVGPRIRGVATGGHAKLDETLMGRLPKLEIVANFGVGYDSRRRQMGRQHGLIVTNTPDVLTEEVADTALGLLLMTVRDLSRSERYLRAGRWEKEGAFPLSTSTLRDKTIGILALGRIGKAIAKRCEAFGLKIAYHGRSAQKDVPYRYYANLAEMAKDVDILLSVAPGGAGNVPHHRRRGPARARSAGHPDQYRPRQRRGRGCADQRPPEQGRSSPPASTCSNTSRTCRPS